MAVAKWNASGRVWMEDHGLLDAEQVAQCERADVPVPLRSPVPTRMISNGNERNHTLHEVKAEKLRGGVPNICWTTEYAQLVQDLPNCYAEIGTTWASSVVTFPTIAAHIMGQLLKYMGEDRIVFGSDSVCYGSPQWQIEAF